MIMVCAVKRWLEYPGLILIAAVLVVAALAVIASAAEPEPAARGENIPDVVIKGEREKPDPTDLFTDLPPRDLVKRPMSESPGLDASFSVVGRKEISWLDATSIVDAMKYVPGAWTETRGRKVKKFFSVRGQRYPYPGYLIDGAWFREFHETNYFFNAANVDRIEILRSSAALLLSPGGMSGMVNIVPRTYEKRETRLYTSYGRFNTWRTQVNHGDRVNENFSYGLGIGYDHTDGPDGLNARENMTNLYGRLAGKTSSNLELSLNTFALFGDRELRLAKPPASNNLQRRVDDFGPVHTYVVVGKARYAPSEQSSTELVANYARRTLDGHRVGAASWEERDYEYGLRLVQTQALGEDNILRVAGMYNHWVSPTGKRFYVGRRGDLHTLAGVIVDEHDFGRLKVNVGYRAGVTYINDFGGFNIEGSAAGLGTVAVQRDWEDPLHTVTAGASYEIVEDLSLLGNVAWGQIASAPGMLTAALERPGMETRTKFDVGLKKVCKDFGKVTVTGFYTLQDDAATLSGGVVTVGGEDYGLYRNADKDTFGIELEVKSERLAGGTQFFANATAMQTRQLNNGQWTRDKEVPGYVFGGGVSQILGDFDVSLFAKHISSYENQRFLAGGSPPAPLGDFLEIGSKVTYSFGPEGRHKVFLGVENICDRNYSTVAGYPDDGTQVKGGVILEW